MTDEIRMDCFGLVCLLLGDVCNDEDNERFTIFVFYNCNLFAENITLNSKPVLHTPLPHKYSVNLRFAVATNESKKSWYRRDDNVEPFGRNTIVDDVSKDFLLQQPD